jgi:chorismate mutase
MTITGIIEKLRARQCQHRAHTLATASDKMPGQFRDQRDFRLHTVQNDRIYLVHSGGDQLEHGFQRWRTISADFMYGCSHNRFALTTAAPQGKCKWRISSCPLRSISAQDAVMDDQETLTRFRESIDNIDAALVFMLAERFKITQAVGAFKAKSALPPADPAREERQIERLRRLARDAKLDPDFTEKFLRFIIDEVIRHHQQIRDAS